MINNDNFALGPLTRAIMELTLRLPSESTSSPSLSSLPSPLPSSSSHASSLSTTQSSSVTHLEAEVQLRDGEQVCFQNVALGKTMRVRPDGSGEVSADGLFGPLGTFVRHTRTQDTQ